MCAGKMLHILPDMLKAIDIYVTQFCLTEYDSGPLWERGRHLKGDEDTLGIPVISASTKF